jgi:hypothetical protein
MKTMSDAELIARLLDWEEYDEGKINDAREAAADRIEDLTAENAKLHDHIEGVAKNTHKIMVGYEAKLAKVEAGLRDIAKRDEQMIWGEDYEVEEAFKDMRDIAYATLAEIKSGVATTPYGLEGESHE